MNKTIQKSILLILFALGVPLLGSGQAVNLSTYEGTVVEHEFTSAPNSPNITGDGPLHGNAALQEIGTFQHKLVYEPDPGYVGTDQVKVFFWSSPGNYGVYVFNITVLPSEVVAFRDQVTTTINTPVDVLVTDNDYSNRGVLILNHVPLSNHGTTTVDADLGIVTFTPASDFEGLTNFSYVVCDDIGTCDLGTVSVHVVTGTGSSQDTTHIFTREDRPQVVLLPTGYTHVDGPFNGAYDTSPDVPLYSPNSGFVGSDIMTFDYMGQTQVVKVEVLPYQPNLFAKDDYFYLTSVESVELNVLDNDLYGNSADCFYIGTPEFGTLTQLTPRRFLYTPPAGFNGLDRVNYSSRPPQCDGDPELATAFIFVGNYEPKSAVYDMQTVRATPLLIDNTVPVGNFDFTIADQPDLGTVQFLAAGSTYTVLDSQIVGENQVLYIPDSDIAEGTDDFEVIYRVLNYDGDPVYEKTVKINVDILNIGDGSEPMCFNDCVWAGDTNADGVVNMQDLMPIGLCMGEIGFERTENNLTEWYGLKAIDWTSSAQAVDLMPFNLKHLDADGDGLVNAGDTFAINQFYGNYHGIQANTAAQADYEIIVEGDLFASPGDYVELDLIMGTDDAPAYDVYGFTYNFPYDTAFFEPTSIDISFPGNSWLAYNTPVLYLKRNEGKGLLESGFTRTNGLSASGIGKIGKLSFIVSDDIEGFRPGEERVVPVEVTGATAMNSAGQSLSVATTGFNLHIVYPDEDTPKPELTDDLLKVYPNPSADGTIMVHLNGGHEFTGVEVFNLAGQRVYQESDILARRKPVFLSDLGSGLYILSVQTAEGVLKQKIEIIR